MIRYDMNEECEGESGNCVAAIVPRQEGDYVLYADAQAEINRIVTTKQWLREAIAARDEIVGQLNADIARHVATCAEQQQEITRLRAENEAQAREIEMLKRKAEWQPMESAPLDGTTVLLLIQDSEYPLTDDSVSVSLGAYGTKGGPEYDPTWSFAGWDWEQDVFREGGGTPIGWMPQPEVPEALAAKEE